MSTPSSTYLICTPDAPWRVGEAGGAAPGNQGPERSGRLAKVEELVGGRGRGLRAEAALNSDPQEASRSGAPGSERILLDILEHDWREAQDSRQELCQKLHDVQGELQWAEELRDKVMSTLNHRSPCPAPTFLLANGWGKLLGRGR